MPKEHSGGVQHAGLFLVPAEWSDEQRVAVKIDHFDFDSLDSIDDMFRDELRTKGTVRGLLNKLLKMEITKAREEAAVAVLTHIISAEDSGLAACQLAFASGMMALTEKTMTEVGLNYGVSKQDFQQAVDRKCDELELRKTRTMRDEEARDKMRLSNYRPGERP